jgi:hypothetical protein
MLVVVVQVHSTLALMSHPLTLTESPDEVSARIHPARRIQPTQGPAPRRLHDKASRVDDVDPRFRVRRRE